jgi:hypothetical protein
MEFASRLGTRAERTYMTLVNKKAPASNRAIGRWIELLSRRGEDGRPAIDDRQRAEVAKKLGRVRPGRPDIVTALEDARVADPSALVRVSSGPRDRSDHRCNAGS